MTGRIAPVRALHVLTSGFSHEREKCTYQRRAAHISRCRGSTSRCKASHIKETSTSTREENNAKFRGSTSSHPVCTKENTTTKAHLLKDSTSSYQAFPPAPSSSQSVAAPLPTSSHNPRPSCPLVQNSVILHSVARVMISHVPSILRRALLQLHCARVAPGCGTLLFVVWEACDWLLLC